MAQTAQEYVHGRSLWHVVVTASLAGEPWIGKPALLDSVLYPEIAASLAAQLARISRSMRWNGACVKCKDVVLPNYARTYLVGVVACVAYTPSKGSSEAKYGLIVRGWDRISSSGTASVWRVDRDCSLYRLVDEPLVQATFFRQLDADLTEVLH